MRTFFLTLGAALNMYLSGSAVASAQSYGGWLCRRYGIYCGDSGGSTTNVPEIDVSSGLLAVAAVAATLALVWEINRRRKGA